VISGAVHNTQKLRKAAAVGSVSGTDYVHTAS